MRPELRKRLLVIFSAVILAFIAICFLNPEIGAIIWDGSFWEVEYVILLRGEDGKPLRDVQLTVKGRLGENSFSYPVTDYYPGHLPTSDKEGKLVFHHVGKGVEFGGRCVVRRIFKSSDDDPNCHGPVYFCCFSYKGEVIFQVKYNDLNTEISNSITTNINELPKVSRNWKWTDEMVKSLPPRFALRFEDPYIKEEIIAFPVFQKNITIPDLGVK